MHVVQSSLMLLGVLIQPCGNSVVLIGRSLSGTEPEQPGVCNLFLNFHGLYLIIKMHDRPRFPHKKKRIV